MYRTVLSKLTTQQIRDLLVENFGESHAKYHTLDEIQLSKLIAKLPPDAVKELEQYQTQTCSNCGKQFNPSVHGGKEINEKWFCLDCYWNYEEEELTQKTEVT